jgi:hypothetical protein
MWVSNDRRAWADEAFEVVKGLLEEREVEIPPQAKESTGIAPSVTLMREGETRAQNRPPNVVGLRYLSVALFLAGVLLGPDSIGADTRFSKALSVILDPQTARFVKDILARVVNAFTVPAIIGFLLARYLVDRADHRRDAIARFAMGAGLALVALGVVGPLGFLRGREMMELDLQLRLALLVSGAACVIAALAIKVLRTQST